MIWPDNRSYIGEYCQDKKHGNGIFLWSDNRTYIGGWSMGKQHGIGVFISSDGETKKGEWCEGKRLRWCDEQEGCEKEAKEE